MIRRIIDRVLGKHSGGPRIIPRRQHGIANTHISPCAVKTTSVLQDAGFKAFIVGGAVRDLILGKEPKDFDVATDATPEEVNHLFRRSRIIGRRFRLVHVMCGRDTVEVSTFRAVHSNDHGIDEEDVDRQTDASGRVLRDNVFGDQEEDAMRRDFTINALYFDPNSGEVWDYHNGVSDLKSGVLRMIGDPITRYREDPVRMLRAVRLAAKLNLKLDKATRAPIKNMADLLEAVPPSRLFDEMLKLLLSGHALESMKWLRAEGLHHGLLPMLDVVLEQPMGERFITLSLKNTDERISQDKPVSPAFLFASLLWHEVLVSWQKNEAEGMPPIPALNDAMEQVIQAQVEKLAIPRRFTTIMKEIWGLQPRLLKRSGVRPFRLLEHPRFRAGFDFLQLRCESGEVDVEVGEWWEKFQNSSENERKAMLKPEAAEKKRRRRRKKPANRENAQASAES